MTVALSSERKTEDRREQNSYHSAGKQAVNGFLFDVCVQFCVFSLCVRDLTKKINKIKLPSYSLTNMFFFHFWVN